MADAERISEDAIIRGYNELVESLGGRPLGEGVFKRESGISPYYWHGGYWRSWSAFQTAAGHKANMQTQKIPDDVLVRRFIELVIDGGRIPTQADLKLRKRADGNFPGEAAFRRFGSVDALFDKAAEFCENDESLAAALPIIRPSLGSRSERRVAMLNVLGFVYLLRSGKHFKIGRTNATGRRLRELAIQLPRKPDTVHVIETDDPEGIEAYWHRRFADKRGGGEWFVLSADDVRAFKARKFQ